jgi:hypothetical protein
VALFRITSLWHIKKLTWAGNVARMRERTGEHLVLVKKKSEGRRLLGRPRRRWQDKQEGKCMCDVTLGRVHESLLLWKSYRSITCWSVWASVSVRECGYAGAWVCARSYMRVTLLIQMKRKCDILWRHLWPLGLDQILRHCLINGTTFRKKVLYIKCVF